MMIDRYPYRIIDDKIIFRGVSFGYGIGGRLDIIYRNGSYLIAYHKTSADWVGLGQTASVPATYMLVVIDDKVATVIKDISPGYQWRKARKELIAECDKLAEIQP